MAEQTANTEILSDIVGKHIIYIYENSWRYEIYIKNSSVIDYRIHSGMVAGRWVRGQQAHIVKLREALFRLSWDEPTGTAVSLAVDLSRRKIHCFAVFPRWIKDNPQKTVCFQNAHLAEMRQYRDAGPVYPHFVLDEWADIIFLEDCGADNEDIISCAPADLPKGYADRRN